MKNSRPILGYRSLQYNTSKIMSELKWNTIYHMIMKESITFIHKCVFDNQPRAITEFYTMSIDNKNNIRSVRKPMIKNITESDKMKHTLLYNGMYLYNKLPNDIKGKNPKLFAKHLQRSMGSFFPSDRITRYEPGKISLIY